MTEAGPAFIQGTTPGLAEDFARLWPPSKGRKEHAWHFIDRRRWLDESLPTDEEVLPNTFKDFWGRGTLKDKVDEWRSELDEETDAIFQEYSRPGAQGAAEHHDLDSDEDEGLTAPPRRRRSDLTREGQRKLKEITKKRHKQLCNLAKEYDYVSGKFLISGPRDECAMSWLLPAPSLTMPCRMDQVFVVLAHAISHPKGKVLVQLLCQLSSAQLSQLFHEAIDLMKVSCDPAARRLVSCLYTPNCFDKEEILRIWKILVGELGLDCATYKADIFTRAGIYHSGERAHDSGIQSTLHRHTDAGMFGKGGFELYRRSLKAKSRKKETAAQEAKRGPKLDDSSDEDEETEDEDMPPPKRSKA